MLTKMEVSSLGVIVLYLVPVKLNLLSVLFCMDSAFIVYKCCETTVFIFLSINSANSLIWHIN